MTNDGGPAGKPWTNAEDFRRDVQKHLDTFYDTRDLDNRPTTQTETEMQITSIRVGKKVIQNLGDYNSAHFEFAMDAAVAEGEDIAAATAQLVGTINAEIQKQINPEAGPVVAAEVTATPVAPTPTPVAPTGIPAPNDPGTPMVVPASAPAAEIMDEGKFTSAVVTFMEGAGGPDKVGMTLAQFSADRVPAVPADKRVEFLAALNA